MCVCVFQMAVKRPHLPAIQTCSSESERLWGTDLQNKTRSGRSCCWEQARLHEAARFCFIRVSFVGEKALRLTHSCHQSRTQMSYYFYFLAEKKIQMHTSWLVISWLWLWFCNVEKNDDTEEDDDDNLPILLWWYREMHDDWWALLSRYNKCQPKERA